MPRPRPRRTATKKGASGTVRLAPAEDPSFLDCAPLVCGRFHSRIFESGWSDVFIGVIAPNILLRERTRERTRSSAPSPLQAAGWPPREASRLESLERACLHLAAPGAAPPRFPALGVGCLSPNFLLFLVPYLLESMRSPIRYFLSYIEYLNYESYRKRRID